MGEGNEAPTQSELLKAVSYLVEWIEFHAIKPAEITELCDAKALLSRAGGEAE